MTEQEIKEKYYLISKFDINKMLTMCQSEDGTHPQKVIENEVLERFIDVFILQNAVNVYSDK